MCSSDLEDRALLEAAAAALQGLGDDDAIARVVAVFPRYPDVVEVQDLRCRIALERGASEAAASEECAPLMQLLGDR